MNEEEKDAQKQQSESKQSGGRMTQWWRRRDSGTKGLIIIGFLIFVFLAWPSYEEESENTYEQNEEMQQNEEQTTEQEELDEDLKNEATTVTWTDAITGEVEINQKIKIQGEVTEVEGDGGSLDLLRIATEEGGDTYDDNVNIEGRFIVQNFGAGDTEVAVSVGDHIAAYGLYKEDLPGVNEALIGSPMIQATVIEID